MTEEQMQENLTLYDNNMAFYFTPSHRLTGDNNN